MHIKQRYIYLSALVFLVGCLAFGGWVWSKFSLPWESDNQIVRTAVVQHTNNANPSPTSQPDLNLIAGAHLLIPVIGVDAPIEPIGVSSNNVLEVPQKNQWTGVGWYKNGPLPGQPGSAIIDGHLDRPGGAPAVFWKLNQLHAGDIVTVAEAQGKTLRFRVIQVQAYQPTVAPLQKIYGNTSGTYLNLITCAGQWVPAQHQTTERLVVYTQMV